MINGVYRVSKADLAPQGAVISLENPIFDAFAEALDFPDWFGRNWDALEDLLTERSGVLVLRNARPGDELGVLIDVLQSVADYWREQDEPFAAVFVDPDNLLDLPEP